MEDTYRFLLYAFQIKKKKSSSFTFKLDYKLFHVVELYLKWNFLYE